MQRKETDRHRSSRVQNHYARTNITSQTAASVHDVAAPLLKLRLAELPVNAAGVLVVLDGGALFVVVLLELGCTPPTKLTALLLLLLLLLLATGFTLALVVATLAAGAALLALPALTGGGPLLCCGCALLFVVGATVMA
jgi:membrane-bound ClpP family serine protease